MRRVLGIALVLMAAAPAAALASTSGGDSLVITIGRSIVAATILAYLAHLARQPLILAYIAAGAVIGPHFGLGWVSNKEDIQIIAEIGLILLLYTIGLELDLKKLRQSGRSLVVVGALQFVLCVVLGLGFFRLLGFTIGAPYRYVIFGVQVQGGEYDLAYLAACMALSSTAIVVKLLHHKQELDTLAGRLTVGVLVFQDLWAIALLTIQPSLAHPDLAGIAREVVETVLLIVVCLGVSRFFLGVLFRRIAALPELVLVASLGWCFFVSGSAAGMGLSREMGALIAGAVISTFPYNLDVVAKILSIRDFFLMLFFVALGMEIPNPADNLGMLLVAASASAFLIVSRFASVFTVLRLLGHGNRIGLLTSINLAQLSEFALVVTAIGLKSGHIVGDIQTIVIYTFAMTAVASTYCIKFSHQIQGFLTRQLGKMGLGDAGDLREEVAGPAKDVVVLGFFRLASAFLREAMDRELDLAQRTAVIDINPAVVDDLEAAGVRVIYGDIGSLETLHHARVGEAKVVVCTVPETLLIGTDNVTLIQHVRKLAPDAKIVIAASTSPRAVELYREGADFVLLPNELAARQLLDVVEKILDGELPDLREDEQARLAAHKECLS